MDKEGNMLLQRYELGRLLGEGTFAKVYHSKCTKTGQCVAIKVIDKEKVLRVGIIDQIKREISVMRLLRHPNIVQLYEVMATKTKIYFVLEYAKGGELFNKVAKRKLKENVARKYFQQLVNAVDFCHSRGIYHRDLKPENLLLDENENIKVSDFGLSALAKSKHQDGLLHTICGTPVYVAPEVINRKGYDGAKADIWSCGVILFVLLAGYLPFHDPNLMEMYSKIEKAEYKCPSWFPAEVRKLLSRILDPNPRTRISIALIKENPWFKRGLNSKATKIDTDSKQTSSLHTGIATGPCEFNSVAAEEKQEIVQPTCLNAFEIISHSPGFDLSSLFEDPHLKKEARFSSRQRASVIISKLEEMAKHLNLKVKKKVGGLLEYEGAKEGRKGILCIHAEIYEITPSFHLVEVKKSAGDTLEYRKILQEGIRPALEDIVWAWQGDHHQHLQMELQPQPLPEKQRRQQEQLHEQLP
ncbi:CBL-interacting protein kinase 2-like [Diospyros lotus]|uniref:CBL-interacting protein kinase 2-like n=1 Tax=Diospyros lotus TaxID=55363 RepID=UPI00224D8194|nr:CBL-interacting protein kinase 2-like [Diospyros lotus]